MPRRRDADEAGRVKCARCGEFKDPAVFNRGDSYCKPCRKAYAREYHLSRASQDNKYLPIKAAKARLAYRTNPQARARRLESSAKWRSKLENAAAKLLKGSQVPEPARKISERKTKEVEQRREAADRWSDL